MLLLYIFHPPLPPTSVASDLSRSPLSSPSPISQPCLESEKCSFPLAPRPNQAFTKRGREILRNININQNIRKNLRQNMCSLAWETQSHWEKYAINPRQDIELKYGSLSAKMVSAGAWLWPLRGNDTHDQEKASEILGAVSLSTGPGGLVFYNALPQHPNPCKKQGRLNFNFYLPLVRITIL